MTEWIAQLASADANTRRRAAEELYRRGRNLGDAAISSWVRLPEFSALIAGAPTVGIAVRPENFEKIRVAMGLPRLAIVPPDQDAMEFEVHLGTAQLDILTTQGAPGAIAKFLEKFGEGIQQVEYPTTDVDHVTRILQGKLGLNPIYPATRAGADGTHVNFFLASTPGGRKVLIELVESSR